MSATAAQTTWREIDSREHDGVMYVLEWTADDRDWEPPAGRLRIRVEGTDTVLDVNPVQAGYELRHAHEMLSSSYKDADLTDALESGDPIDDIEDPPEYKQDGWRNEL